MGNRRSQKEKQMKEKKEKNGAHFEERRTNAKIYGSA
jgi:hypothetical protein